MIDKDLLADLKASQEDLGQEYLLDDLIALFDGNADEGKEYYQALQDGKKNSADSDVTVQSAAIVDADKTVDTQDADIVDSDNPAKIDKKNNSIYTNAEKLNNNIELESSADFQRHFTSGGGDCQPSSSKEVDSMSNSLTLYPFLPDVSDADIAEIAALSKSEKDALKLKINNFDLRDILPLAEKNGGIICPICGNGRGENGTGIIPKESTDENKNNYLYYHCFKGNDFEGKLTKIIYRRAGDWNTTLAIGKKLMAQDKVNFNLPPVSSTKEYSPEDLAKIKSDIAAAQEHLAELPLDDRRALNFDTYEHFHCGFIRKWVHPKTQSQYPTPRIIVPTSEYSYNAVLPKSARESIDKKYWKMNAGHKELFNVEDIIPDQPVIVVEGEIDAMSIWQVTGESVCVVALGGVANKDKFLQTVDNKIFPADKINCQFIILFDNDKAGIENADDLKEKLINAGYPAAVEFFPDAYKLFPNEKIDANFILTEKGESVLKSCIDDILKAAQIKLTVAVGVISAQKNNSSTVDTPDEEEVKFLDSLKTIITNDCTFAFAELKELKDVDTIFTPDVIHMAAFLKVFNPLDYAKIEMHLTKYVKAKLLKDRIKAVEEKFYNLRGMIVKLEQKLYPTENKNQRIAVPPELSAGLNLFYPDGYKISRQVGIVAGKLKISPAPIVINRIYRRSDSSYCCDIVSRVNGKILKLRQINLGVISNARKITDLSDFGLPIISNCSRELVQFLSDFRAVNSNALSTIDLHQKLGWTDDNQTFISPYDDKFVIDKNNTLARHLRVKGEKQKWLSTVKQVYDTSPIGRAIFSSSLASLILPVIGCRAFCLYLRCKSKAGKSAAFKLAASSFGDSQILKSLNATINALESVVAGIAPFPAIFDERQVAGKNFDVSNFIYRLGESEGRGRCNVDGTFKDTAKWKNITICNGEESLTENATTQGVHTRTLELNFDGDKIMPDELARSIHVAFDSGQSFGHGAKIFLDNLRGESIENLKEMYTSLCADFETEFSAFIDVHCRHIAAITVADFLALKYLFNFEPDQALKSAKENAANIFALLQTQEALSDEKKIKDFILGWIAENRLHFENMQDKDERLVSPVYGIAKIGDGLYITVKSIKEACEKAGYKSFSTVKEHMFKCGVFEKINGKVNYSKKISGVNCRVIKISAEYVDTIP